MNEAINESERSRIAHQVHSKRVWTGTRRGRRVQVTQLPLGIAWGVMEAGDWMSGPAATVGAAIDSINAVIAHLVQSGSSRKTPQPPDKQMELFKP